MHSDKLLLFIRQKLIDMIFFLVLHDGSNLRHYHGANVCSNGIIIILKKESKKTNILSSTIY